MILFLPCGLSKVVIFRMQSNCSKRPAYEIVTGWCKRSRRISFLMKVPFLPPPPPLPQREEKTFRKIMMMMMNSRKRCSPERPDARIYCPDCVVLLLWYSIYVRQPLISNIRAQTPVPLLGPGVCLTPLSPVLGGATRGCSEAAREVAARNLGREVLFIAVIFPSVRLAPLLTSISITACVLLYNLFSTLPSFPSFLAAKSSVKSPQTL